jgi:3-hydroxybenzoate 6-monooxygenase
VKNRSDTEGEILIVGGGIGGLTSALTVARSGWKVRVVERKGEFREIGAGLQLGANATRVLHQLGLLEEILDVAVVPRRLVLRSAISGEELTALTLGDEYTRRYGGPYVVCHRNDLLRILLKACARRPSISLEPNTEVVDVYNLGDTIEALCEDGSRLSAVAAIGADGLRSCVRRVFGDDNLNCEGFVSYRGAIPLAEASNPSALDEVVGWIAPDLHFIQYALRAGDLYNQVAVFRSKRYQEGKDDWGTPDELDSAFASTCQPLQLALQSIHRDMRWYMFDREPLKSWTQGRIALLGDAAHPMFQYLAQGACQAIEDADALGIAMGARKGGGHDASSIPSALVAYEESRMDRANEVQRRARVWGNIWHTKDPLSVSLRDALFASRAPDDYRYTDWLFLSPSEQS